MKNQNLKFETGRDGPALTDQAFNALLADGAHALHTGASLADALKMPRASSDKLLAAGALASVGFVERAGMKLRLFRLKDIATAREARKKFINDRIAGDLKSLGADSAAPARLAVLRQMDK